MRPLEASMITQAIYKTPGTREKIVRKRYTREGVEMRSMRDPGEYLIVQCLRLEIQRGDHQTMPEILLGYSRRISDWYG